MNLTDKKPVISLISLGCSKNTVDSELMLGMLSDAGYQICLDEESADLVIVNTCSFISQAEKESVKTIMELVSRGKKVIITGCLPQKHGEEVLDAIPEASAILGTSDIKNIVSVVDDVFKNPEKQYCLLSSEIDYIQTDDIQRYHITMGPYAYLKISEGCNWKCSYCLIPSLKGRYRSRKIESIVLEARKLAESGVAEIVLIAQDTTSYGIDIYNHPALTELLQSLEQVDEIKWIRLMYTYPRYFDDELIAFIADSKKVLKYLDIPLQHAHPDILKAMRRPEIDVVEFISKLRSQIKNLAIRTCFIVGFPGETDEHFDFLCQFVQDQQFERLGVFEYSKEDNTPAAKFADQIKAGVKKQRRKRLMAIQNEISLNNHLKLTGKTLDVLLEKISGSGSGVGRSYLDAPEIDGLVYVNAVSGYLPADIIPVKITRVSAYDLYGEIAR